MPKICTAWISWEKSFNLKVLSIANSKHKLGSAKHVCDVPSTKTSFSDTNTYWCSCVSTPWAYIVNVPPYCRTIVWNWNFCIRKTFLWKVKPDSQIHPHSQCLVPGAWCPPFRNPNLQLQFFLCKQFLIAWLHLKCRCWRLSECHFIYDNVIQILVYEKNWHTLTLFSWALIDA